MKIAKDLLKIAHELDDAGHFELADSIDKVAADIYEHSLVALAATPVAQLTEIIQDPSATQEVKSRAIAMYKRILPKLDDYHKDMVDQLEKAYIKKDIPTVKPIPKEIRKRQMDAAKQELKEFEKVVRDSDRRSFVERARDKLTDVKKPSSSPSSTTRVRELADKARGLADRAKAYRADPSNSWKTGLKGAKPGMVSGLLGGAAGAHAGATIGEAIGGDVGEMVGGIAGGIAGGAAAATPVGKALLAGWTIGTIINNLGLEDKIQQALSAEDDASAEAGQLKDMIEIFDKTAKIIDHPATPVETKVKKYLNIENLINNIIKHPAALPVLGQDGVEKFRGSKAKMDADIAAAAASAPAADVSPAGSAPAVKAPRKVSPSPAIIQLQKNLNKLHDAGSISLPAKLVEDGFVGKYTRGAIRSFDPASGGRVTRDLLKRVSEAASNAGIKESPAPAEPPMSIAAPFVSSEPMMSPSPSRMSAVAPFNSGGVAR